MQLSWIWNWTLAMDHNPLLDAEHSLCTAAWSGTPCRMTSAQSRTMSPLDGAWKPGFSPDSSVFSALETFVITVLYKSTFTIPYRTTVAVLWRRWHVGWRWKMWSAFSLKNAELDSRLDCIAMALCRSVCLSQADVLQKPMDGLSSFSAQWLPSTYPALCHTKIYFFYKKN